MSKTDVRVAFYFVCLNICINKKLFLNLEGISMALDAIWRERKRLWCGLPFTFTQYILLEDRLLVRSGLFNSKEDEVRLYRIKDVSITKSLTQKIFGLGTIHIESSDSSLGNFDLKNIKDSYNKKEQLSQMVEAARTKKNASIREYTGSDGDLEDEDGGIDTV